MNAGIRVLGRDSAERRRLAWRPHVEIDGVPHVAVFSGRRPAEQRLAFRAIVETDLGETQVVARMVPVGALGRPGALLVWAQALRLDTWVQSLLPAVIGLHGASVSVWALVLGAVACAHGGANLLDAAYDHVLGDGQIDRHGKLGPVARGWLGARTAATVGAVLALIAVALGLFLAWRSGPGLLVAGLGALVLGWQWAAPPLRWGRTALGDFVLPWIFGPAIAVGAAYAAGGITTAAVVGGLVAGVGVSARRLIRTARRAPEDTFAGRGTLARALGFNLTKRVLYGLFAVMWVAPVAFPGAGSFTVGRDHARLRPSPADAGLCRSDLLGSYRAHVPAGGRAPPPGSRSGRAGLGGLALGVGGIGRDLVLVLAPGQAGQWKSTAPVPRL